MPKASLIISIYNSIDFLRVVLDSLQYQTEQDFEIIISEDAQHLNVKEFIHSYPFKNQYLHLSQEDTGWQKNKALNRAIQAANADWLIFIDGDCVLHPRFVEFHVKQSAPDRILCGKRVKLNNKLTAVLLSNSVNILRMQHILFSSFLANSKRIKFVEEGFFINPTGLLGFIPRMRKMRHLTGSNMSFSKQAIVAINGFDEDYVKPAYGEDRDLSWRFIAAGYHHYSLRNLAVQYHLHHTEIWQDQSENTQKAALKIAANQFVCKNGIQKF